MGNHLVQMQFATSGEFDGAFVVNFLIHQGADQAQFAILHKTQIDLWLFAEDTHDNNRCTLASVLNSISHRGFDADTLKDQISFRWAKVTLKRLGEALLACID